MATLDTGADRLLQRWVEAVNHRDVTAVVALYHPEAQFWGTLAGRLRSRPADFKDYFSRFLSCDRMQVELGDLHLWPQGDGPVLAAGEYRFVWQTGPRTPPVAARARFTMVLGRQDGRWQILQHHSSDWVHDGI